MYDADPYVNITDPAQRSLVIGAQTCAWGEEVSDAHHCGDTFT